MEKEYIVVLNADVDFAQFNQEMIVSTGAGVIPNRTVDVANPRPASKRSTHYSLTDEEAEELKNDSRVRAVEIPPQDRDDIKIGPRASQSGDFRKTSLSSGSYLNWGMRRCMESINPYGTSNNDPGGDFTYTLDGTGVDIVIQDSGIQPDHPEFNDADGVSRVQQIDWYSGFSGGGSQHADHYRDHLGHGTHVAGIAAGLTYGWAKNARIYAVKILDGGDGTGISETDCFDVIKEWHNNKTNGRPTIVNMSWGYYLPIGNDFTIITSVDYRGTTYNSGNDPRWHESDDYMAETYGLYPDWDGVKYSFPWRFSWVDSDIEEMIDDGIHVCIAAGNNSFKADISTGIDYNNILYIPSLGGGGPYHQGSSPLSEEAFMVGSIDSTTYNSSLEQISSFSTRGPLVNIYAPGSNIRSAISNTNDYGENTNYYLNSSYKQATKSGTSMASPQVCGLGATILELNPHLTPAQLLQKMTNLATDDKLHSTSLDNDYNDTRSLLDSDNKFLNTPFNSQYPLTT